VQTKKKKKIERKERKKSLHIDRKEVEKIGFMIQGQESHYSYNGIKPTQTLGYGKSPFPPSNIHHPSLLSLYSF